MNNYQKLRFVRRVIGAMFNTIRNKRLAVLGFAYKVRAPALQMAGALQRLLQRQQASLSCAPLAQHTGAGGGGGAAAHRKCAAAVAADRVGAGAHMP